MVYQCFFLISFTIWSSIIAFHFSHVKNYRKDNVHLSVVRFAIDNKKNNPIVNVNKQNKSTSKKSKYTSSMIKYEEELIKPWQLSDSVNSTTLKLLFNLQEEITNFWFKLEQQWSSWSIMITSKVERDIRVTLGASDYVTRKVTKDTEKIFTGVQDLQKPIRSLPSKLKAITSKSETLSLIMRGVDTTEGSKLLGGFSSQSTKERSVQLKKQKQKLSLPTGGVDSVYRSIRTLPSKLQYDYQRRVVKQKQSLGDGYTNDDMIKATLTLPSAAADLEISKLTSLNKQLGTWNSDSADDVKVTTENSSLLDESILEITLTQAVAYVVQLAISNKFEKLSLVLKRVQKVIFDRQLDKWILNRQELVENGTDLHADIAKDIFSINVAIKAVSNLDNMKVQYYNSSNNISSNIGTSIDSLTIDKRNIEAILIGMSGVSYVRDRLLQVITTADKDNEGDNLDYLLLKDVADEITSILNEDEQLLRTIYRTLESISITLQKNVINKPPHSSVMKQQQNVNKHSSKSAGVIETSMLIIDSNSSLDVPSDVATIINSDVDTALIDDDIAALVPINTTISNGSSFEEEVSSFKPDQFYYNLENEPNLLRNDWDLEGSYASEEFYDNIDKEYYLSVKFSDIEDALLAIGNIPVVSSSAVVVETSAEASDTTEVKVIKFVITAVDVVFFLVETLFKAIGPIVKDGGKKAVQRVVDTLFIPDELLLLFTSYFPIFSSSTFPFSTYKKLTLKGPILMDVPMNETIRVSLLDTSINWRIYNQLNTAVKLSKLN